MSKPTPTTPRHTMVLIYAEWCGFCKMMKPEWQQFTLECEKIPHVRVIAIESASLGQSLPTGVSQAVVSEIRGFPTIRYYNPSTKKLIDYTGDRTKADFMKFLKKQMSVTAPAAKKKAPAPKKKPSPAPATKKKAPAKDKKKPTKAPAAANGGFVRSGSQFPVGFYSTSS